MARAETVLRNTSQSVFAHMATALAGIVTLFATLPTP
jgi:hypothetical protein